MKMLTSIVVLGAVLMLSTSAGHAAPSALAKTCKADVKQFCADVKPGAGELTACVNGTSRTCLGLSGGVHPSRCGRQGLQADVKSVCATSSAGGGSRMPEGSRRRSQRQLQSAMTKAQAGDK